MTNPAPPDPAARLFAYRAIRALGLGLFAMVAMGWIVSAPPVCLAALAGAAWALVSSQTASLSVLVIGSLAASLLGAMAGALFFVQASTTIRLLAIVVSTITAGPWSVALGFWLRARAVERR
ncbi:MAG TPA: hypothetical protein VLV45_05705 [Gemmatimonadales bacterium]|nr:hypothetical protein [Gemmatimonadales bacterium]